MSADKASYRETFQRYLINGIALLSSAVEATPGALNSELREQALHTLDLGLSAPAAWHEVRGLLLALAPHMERLGAREEWIEFLERGRELAAAQGDFAAEIECMLQLAFLFQLRGKLPDARTCLVEALSKFDEHDAPRLRAAVLNRFAYVAYLQGDHVEATDLANAARRSAPDDALSELAQNSFVWGVLAQARREWAESQQHFVAALHLSEAQPAADTRMVAWSLLNLGTAYRRLGNDTEALACYKRAADLLDQIGDPVHAAVARMNIGNLCLLAGQPAPALEWYASAEPVFRRVNDEMRLALVYTNMGIALRDAGDYARAEQSLRAGIERWEALQVVTALAEALGDLAQLYLLQERPEAAEGALERGLSLLAPIGEKPEVQELAATLRNLLQGCAPMPDD